MLGNKYPFEYELAPVPSTQSEFQEYEVRLKNIGQEPLVNLQVWLHLTEIEDVYVPFGTLGPNEPKTMSFLVHTSRTGEAYLTVYGQEKNGNFYWNQEDGEICSKHKNQVKAKIEAQIAKIKEQYCRSVDVFDRRCKKNEEDVDERMIGHEPIETGSNNC